MDKTTLEYSTLPKQRWTSKAPLYAVYACGGLPLVMGISVAGLYLLTYDKSLEGWGILAVVGGVILVVIGLGILALYAIRTRQSDQHRSRRWLKIGSGLALLLANFPGCLICSAAVSVWRVTVVNTTANPVTLKITANNGQAKSIGPIAPGDRTRAYWFAGEAEELTVATIPPDTPASGTIGTYGMGMHSGGNVVLTVNPNGTITGP